MGEVKIRYLEKRRTKGGIAYYWCCKGAAKFGMEPSEALGTVRAAAITRAEYLNDLFDEVRRPAPPGAVQKIGTLAWMLDMIEDKDYFKELSQKRQNEILSCYKTLRASPLSKAPMADISGEQCESFHSKISKEKSLDHAARCSKWLRWTFNKAIKGKHLKGENPMTGVRVKKPAARQIYWFEDEVSLCVRTADEMEMSSIGTAFQFAFDTGQRECDTIAFPRDNYELGDVLIHQTKTGAIVRIPALPELRHRLDAIAHDCAWIIRNENTGDRYKETNFIHKVAAVMKAAGITGKRFSDLRRSAVVRLAQSGCTIPEIASITGHSYARCEAILQVYLPRTTPMARAAIQKLLDSRKAA